MGARIFSVFGRRAAAHDWLPQDIAEFYRVESALIQAGLRVTSDRGLTDEGDPWFVFCREEDDEVIIHFAYIDGRYVISAPSYCGTSTGVDFRALVQSVIQRHPVLRPRPAGDNLFLHPSALLVMLVASAMLKMGHAAEAAPVKPAPVDAVELKQRDIAPVTMNTSPASRVSVSETQHETLILAAINAAFTTPVQATLPTVIVSALAPIPETFAAPASHVTPITDSSPYGDMQSDLIHGAGSITPVAAPQPTTATSPLVVPAHAPALSALHVDTPFLAFDAAPGPVVQTNFVLAPVMLPAVGSPHPVSSSADPAANAAHLLVYAVSSLPTVEQDLLHTFGVADRTLQVNTLPVVLSSVLHTGVHTTVISAASHGPPADLAPEAAQTGPVASAGPLASSIAPSADSAPEPAQTGPVAVPAPSSVASSAPSSSSDPGGTAAPHVVAPAAPPSPSPSLPATPIVGTDLPTVLAIVQEFHEVVVNPATIISGNQIILYDADALSTNVSAVKSITYDLPDGFSVSLVGLPSELAHATAHM